MSRPRVTRSAVALLAASLAAAGAYAAYARLPVVPGVDLAVLLLSSAAATGLVLALWPARLWSPRGRQVALLAAIAGLVLMLPGPIISAIVVPGCVCPSETLPSPLGIGHQVWMIAGLVGSPTLLGLTALIPAGRPVGTPPEPGAWT